MIQTRPGGDRARPLLAAVGCVGRITSFAETSDGRYLITLTGVCRFEPGEELAMRLPYRQVRADYEAFAGDLSTEERPPAPAAARDRFARALKRYLNRRELDIDWETAHAAPLEALVNSLAMGLATMFVAGVSWRPFAALFALGAVAIALTLVVAPKVGVTVLHDYQKERLTAFLKPSENPADQGYQQNQSRIAIGSGEKTGRGPDATQTKLNFLPEHHTDFIFAVVGERWGFVGAAFVLSMYALLIWRGLRILTVSKNLFGAIVAGGIVAMLMFQVFVNVGMNVGIMPITGIPLPLFSYGGSSVLTTFLAVGLLQSIYAQGRAAASLKGRVLAL